MAHRRQGERPTDARELRNQPSPAGRGRHIDSLLPLCYAVLFCAIALSVQQTYFPIGDTGVESDFYGELVVAAQKLHGSGFAVANYPFKGPVYSFALVAIYTFVRDWYLSAIVLNLVCAAAGLVVIYRLILRLFGRRVAVPTMIGISLVYEFFLLAHKASSDMLFLLLCYGAVALLVHERFSWVRLVAASAVSALAFLTRYNGFFLPVSAIILFMAVNPWRWTWRRRTLVTLVYAGLFCVVCVPWFSVSMHETGRLLATRNLQNVTQEFYGGEREAEIPAGGFTSTFELIRHDPVYFVTHYLANIPRHIWSDMRFTFELWTGILVMLGIVRLGFVRPRRNQWGFMVFPLVYFLSMCVIFHLPRLSLPVVPFYIAAASALIFGGSGGSQLLTRIYGSRTLRYCAIAAVAGAVLFQGRRIIIQERNYYRRRPLFIHKAAGYLKRHAGQRDGIARPLIMARKPHIAYYADLEYQHYPKRFNGVHDFLAYAVKRRVDYIVYSIIEKEHFPGVHFLGELDVTPGVDRIYTESEIVIYQLADWINIAKPAGKEMLAGYIETLVAAERDDDPISIVNACYQIAGLYSMNGRWYDVETYLETGIRAAGRLTEPGEAGKHTVVLTLSLARIYLYQGRNREGIDCIERIIGPYAGSVQPEILANACVIGARHSESLGDETAALRYLEKALDLYRSMGDDRQSAYIQQSIEDLGKER
ncbi:MAG: glycosyltransferase family 39 protein [bacterium]|nr:MAG: glycosyltransferase family 39 protein [bacterium]